MQMRIRFVTLFLAAAAVAAVLVVLAPAARAQAPTPGPAPAGQPNLQGVWRAWNLAQFDLEAHGAKPGVPAGLGFVVDPPDGRIPYRPEALEKRKQLLTKIHEADPYKNSDPLVKCYLPGIPRITYIPFPFEIIQTPQYVAFVYEWSHKKRLVPLGAKPPSPAEEGEGNWLGMPRGRFEGNSLVVDLTNFNAYTWFDAAANFHSDGLKVTEKYTPMGADALQYEATMTDPKVFTRPWTIRMTLQRQKDVGLLDYECTGLLDELGIHHTWPRDFDIQ
jgi:hypothetical protein